MKKRVLFLITTVCFIGTLSFSTSCMAQSDKLRPTWATETYHRDLDKSYLEVVVIKGETDLTKMRRMAQDEIYRRRQVTVGEMGDIWMKAPSIAEWLDKDGTAYFLYQTLKNPTYTPESVTSTDKYPFSARVFVPGCAQIYKGSYGKGAGFITGEVLFIGGIVTTEFMRVNYSQKVAQTHSSKMKEYYARNSRICAITRNACIGGAAALYLWNIIDGAVAKGRPHVQVNGEALTFHPYFSSDHSGIAMNFNF